jgi:hypothetical protein
VAYFKVLSWHYLEGLRETIKNLSSNSWCPDQDSNKTPSENKLRVTAGPICYFLPSTVKIKIYTTINFPEN